ncbi:MAG: OadG family protein [Clostridiaceae bacterium]|nr:OadG family protein [Clostridiaceae bacterium]
MSIFESLNVALICLVIVFAVLAALYFMISILSKALAGAGKKDEAVAADGVRVNDPVSEWIEAEEQTAAAADYSAGELKLKNVDEKTAAMIMAIVSHESGIPLNELVFRSISAAE